MTMMMMRIMMKKMRMTMKTTMMMMMIKVVIYNNDNESEVDKKKEEEVDMVEVEKWRKRLGLVEGKTKRRCCILTELIRKLLTTSFCLSFSLSLSLSLYIYYHFINYWALRIVLLPVKLLQVHFLLCSKYKAIVLSNFQLWNYHMLSLSDTLSSCVSPDKIRGVTGGSHSISSHHILSLSDKLSRCESSDRTETR